MAHAKSKPAQAARPVKSRSRRPQAVSLARQREICERLVAGETLRRICAAPDMPSPATVLKAVARDAAFRKDYEHARELQAAQWAEELLEIADGDGQAAALGEGPPGREDIQRARLRVEVRKWLLARLASPPAGSTQRRIAPAGEEPDLAELTAEERDVLRAILARRLGRSGGGASGVGPA